MFIMLMVCLIGIITLYILYFNEKKSTDSKFNQQKTNLDDEIEKTCKKYDDALDSVNKEISSNHKETKEKHKQLSLLLNENHAKNKKQLEDVREYLEGYIDENIDACYSDYKENLEAYSVPINTQLLKLAEIVDIHSKENNEVNEKLRIALLNIEELHKENSDLRKKIEFYTEIESDSKELNIKEDLDEREALIQKALAEINVESKSRQVSDDIGLPSVEIKRKKVSKKSVSSEEVTNVHPSETNLEVENEDAPNILDEQQRKTYDLMENGTRNVLITGKAGTGKSFLIEVFERSTKKNTLKLAPTGIAALNIDGVTIHSAFGFNNLEKIDLSEMNSYTVHINNDQRKVLTKVDTIIIDEISMVRADTLDKIDLILKIVNESSEAFGGKQMILLGDLFQLPPVTERDVTTYLSEHFGGVYFFFSNSYKNGDFYFTELSVNHRQHGDETFYEILNRVREGKITNEDIHILNNRKKNNTEGLRRVLTVFPKKIDAEKMNGDALSQIDAKEYVYDAQIIKDLQKKQTRNLESIFPVAVKLRLKVGALIMMTANDSEHRWVNGTLGVIKGLYSDHIVVSIDGLNYEVHPNEFSQNEAEYVDGKIRYREVLKVSQYPIMLAYAVTIHKSQGMTYKKMACDLTQCFAAGQAYVALSRCSSLDGLYLLEDISKNSIKVDTVVRDFYQEQLLKMNEA